MITFQQKDRVRRVDSSGPIGTVVEVTKKGNVLVQWDELHGRPHGLSSRELVHAPSSIEHASPLPTIQTPSVDTGSEWSTGTKTRTKTLREAGKLIDGDRANDYDTKDDATGNFNRIAQLWSPILGTTVTATQVALCLTQLKVARIIVNPTKQDSWIDAAGYIALGSEIAEQEQS